MWNSDVFVTGSLADGRIPIVTHATVRMHTEALEDDNTSSLGLGNNGTPVADDPAVRKNRRPSAGWDR